MIDSSHIQAQVEFSALSLSLCLCLSVSIFQSCYAMLCFVACDNAMVS